MPVNIDDIKKMPSEEKLKIIDALWQSIDDDIVEQELESEEDIILREREEAYKTGKMSFDTWQEAQKRLKENAEARLKKK